MPPNVFLVLLLMAEIPNNHRLDVKNSVNHEINCQPQLVSRISEPSTVFFCFG